METHIRVHVTTNARKDSIVEGNRGVYIISVRERPEENRANEAVRSLVATYFGVATSAVRIRAGHRRMNKAITIQVL